MPALGSVFKHGNRNYIFNKNFYLTNLVEKRKTELSFDDCKKIVEETNKIIADFVVDENDGFKLPFGLGYLVAGKYIPKNPATDWAKTKQTFTKDEIRAGKKVLHLNLHTFGYSCRAYWFRVGRITSAKFHSVYMFKPYKTLSGAISKAFGSGRKLYSEWAITDFIEISRLENLMNKKYRKEYKN